MDNGPALAKAEPVPMIKPVPIAPPMAIIVTWRAFSPRLRRVVGSVISSRFRGFSTLPSDEYLFSSDGGEGAWWEETSPPFRLIRPMVRERQREWRCRKQKQTNKFQFNNSTARVEKNARVGEKEEREKAGTEGYLKAWEWFIKVGR